MCVTICCDAHIMCLCAHRAGAQLTGAATVGTLAAGDASFAGAEAGVRAAQSALLDLAARLPARCGVGAGWCKCCGAGAGWCRGKVREGNGKAMAHRGRRTTCRRFAHELMWVRHFGYRVGYGNIGGVGQGRGGCRVGLGCVRQGVEGAEGRSGGEQGSCLRNLGSQVPVVFSFNNRQQNCARRSHVPPLSGYPYNG